MIAQKTFRELRVMALVYACLLLLLELPVILLWPEVYDDLKKSALLRNIGFDFLQRIGSGITDRSEDVAYRNWLAVMLYFRSVNLLGIAASVLLGTALFARERETQTMEFLLSRPVSRASILWQKFWPTAVCVTLPIFVMNTASIFVSRAIEMEAPFWPLQLANLHGCLFALMILAFTTFVSVKCRTQAHVAFWVGGIVVLQIGVYLVPRWRWSSLFRLSDFDWYGPILAGNVELPQMFLPTEGPANSLWTLLGAALFYYLAWRALRDLEP